VSSQHLIDPPSAVDQLRVPVGADVVLRVLEQEGVDVVFGMPGGAVLPLYDAIARGTTIRHVLVRHEQGAGHMAQGYARASGHPGVVFATSGPGATNLVTPIADARMDSTPLVCITGQVRSSLIGTMAFQECDITSVTKPLVKRCWLVRDLADLPDVLHAAFAVARSGRPGPVLVDIPRDIQEAEFGRAPAMDAAGSASAVEVLGPEGRSMAASLELAAQAIVGAQRPVLYVGGGAQGAAAELLVLAQRAELPVVTTLMGKGAFPESHPLFIGWPGMHGTKTANLALHDADLIIAAGARFDDRVTGRVDTFAPVARVVHIDVDRTEHGKIRHADVAVHGYLDQALSCLSGLLGDQPPDRSAWHAQLREWHLRFPLGHAKTAGPLKPQAVVRRLAALTADRRDLIWTTGVGQHQMWAMQYLPVDRPRAFITSGGHGTMGFGLPSAIGARLARPGATVICVDGDGSFQMTLQELATAVAEDLPVIVVIINNGQLGMVHQWQSMFFDQRLSEVDLRSPAPDFASIARGFGALGFDVWKMEELDEALAAALDAGRPAVIDVRVDSAEACFPMILPGGNASEQLEWNGA
jgi:acetolactate synthase I/II/III large subunit